MVRIKDIAREASLSSSTVSRALRSDPTLSITAETRERIFSIASKLGYRSAYGRTPSYSFLIVHKDTHFLDHIDNGYYFSLRNGIEEEVARTGDMCRFVPFSRIDGELSAHYDGIIVIGNYDAEAQRRILAVSQTKNIVFLGKLNFLPEGFNTVTYDVEECVHIAISALVRAGVKEFIFIDGKDRYSIPERFLKIHAVRAFVHDHPEITLAKYIACDGFGSEAGYKVAKEYLANNKPQGMAIFAATDPLAIGIAKALGESDIKVGEDASIVSINGDNSGLWINPPLTTVDFHPRMMGVEAVHILREGIGGSELPAKCVYFKPDLVEGKSIKGI